MKLTVAWALAAALSLGACATSAPPPPPDAAVAYTVTPVTENGALTRLAVEMRLRGDADGETTIALPREWAGRDELWRQLDDVRVAGATSVAEDGPALRVVRHAAGAPLTVRYTVRSGYDVDPAEDFQKALPVIRPGWFFFHGEGVFAQPSEGDDRPARFAWGAAPTGWTIASDLDHMAGTRPGTVRDVVESVALGGSDVRVLTRQVGGAPVRVAIRGDAWRFTADGLADLIARLFETQNAFWRDSGRPYFVPVAPLRSENPNHFSMYGTGRTDAFAMASTVNAELDQRLLSHELMHTWIARELGDLPAKDEQLQYWLSEGFTDFYADRVLLRSGVWTLEQFVARQNALLRRYAESPVRTAPNSEILRGFWTDRNLERLPYDRGELFATLLDHQLRSRSSVRASLDDVMRAQRARAAANARAGVRVSAAELFPVVMREHARFEVDELVTRHMERGEPILLPLDLYGDCATVETVTRPPFHRGFEPVEIGQPIGAVDPRSPAWAAGVREGMVLLKREAGELGDSSQEIAYRMRVGSAERVFRYMPTGQGLETFQTVTLTGGAAPGRRSECAALMSGG